MSEISVYRVLDRLNNLRTVERDVVFFFYRKSQIIEFFSGTHKLELSDRKGIPTRLWSSESIFHQIQSSIYQSADEFHGWMVAMVLLGKELIIHHLYPAFARNSLKARYREHRSHFVKTGRFLSPLSMRISRYLIIHKFFYECKIQVADR